MAAKAAKIYSYSMQNALFQPQFTTQSAISQERSVTTFLKVYRSNFLRCFPEKYTVKLVSSQSFSTSSLYKHQQTERSFSEVEEPDILYKRVRIELKGHDPAVINSYEKFTQMTANELDVTVGKITTPKIDFNRYTVLRSVHIFKKHRVQYELRTHFRTIELKHLTGSTAETFLEYIQRNLPEGMAMKVTRTRLEDIPEHIQQSIEKNKTGQTKLNKSDSVKFNSSNNVS